MAVITISRQYGAGGKTLGNMLARKLKYYFAEDDIIQMVAREAKVSSDWVECIEREAGSTLLKFISAPGRKGFRERFSDNKRGYIDEEIYVDLLQQIITKIAKEGNAVILGRGSQYALRGHRGVYHILLIADRADRLKFIEKHYGLSPQKAKQAVERREKRRANLYRKYGRKDYDQPHLYHLVLNMSQLNLKKALKLVCKLIEK